MLRMARDHAAEFPHDFWAICSRALHLAHTPPPTQEFHTWDAARIEPSAGFKLGAFIIADSDLRHSRPRLMEVGRKARVKLAVGDQRQNAVPRRGDVTVIGMLTRRLLPTARRWLPPRHCLHDRPTVPNRGALSGPQRRFAHGSLRTATSTQIGIALRYATKPSPGDLEMNGFASLRRISALNRLARSLLLGLAWLALAPVASAQSPVWIGVTIYDDAPARLRAGTVVLVVHEGSPAYAMGVRPGDVLVEVDGLRIANSNHFLCLIAAHMPGETIKLSTIRAGERRVATITLAERPVDFYVTPYDCMGSVSQTTIGRLELAASTWK